MLTWFNTGGAQFPTLGFVTTFVDPHVVEPVQDPVLAQFAYGPVGAVYERIVQKTY